MLTLIKLLFKLIAALLVAVLTIVVSILKFLFCFAVVVLNIISGIFLIIGVITLIMDNTTNGIIIIVIAFLISPFGIPRIVDWLIDKLDDINEALKNFIKY